MESQASFNAVGLYYHIPFCLARCRYCDFNTYAGIEAQIPEYIRSLKAETGQWAEFIPKQAIDTVYFGGGTPSLVPVPLLRQVLMGAKEVFSFTEDAEITAEANPGTVNVDVLHAFREAGINRLSFGVQSFADNDLRMLGRIHSAEDARCSVRDARLAGFENISLDLMFGLPGQHMDDWSNNLCEVTALLPSHISLYSLTIEKDTPLWQDIRSGRVPEPDNDVAAEMYVKAEEMLEKAGYTHYEISNWARPGFECRHNLRYWRCKPYLGLGAGAHSFFMGYRFENMKSPDDYVVHLVKSSPLCNRDTVKGDMISDDLMYFLNQYLPVEKVEKVSYRNMLSDRIILGLRLREGIDTSALQEETGYNIIQACAELLDELKNSGLLEILGGRVRLSQRGRLLGNEVFQCFLDPPGIPGESIVSNGGRPPYE
jgi:oxygen-independent coproporphyrinogen-3 oxidase